MRRPFESRRKGSASTPALAPSGRLLPFFLFCSGEKDQVLSRNDELMSQDVDPWFQALFAERIGGSKYGKGTEIYKFEKIKRAKRAALQAHPERRLLDFGIGENDDMADPLVRDTLKREVDQLENRGYADNGIDAFKEAVASLMNQIIGL